MGFSDDFMELAGKKAEFKDWMTGEVITESFKEGTPFNDTLLEVLEMTFIWK